MKQSLLTHYQKTKRDLPWRKTSDPYKIWVSEIFLQQTQVSRVIDFYQKFLEKFPDGETLSKATWEEFVPYFQGLGFYSRGRNMLKTAQMLMTEFSGKFPENKKDLECLPGVGDYTSSAIMSFAFQQNFPAFDVNLFRVLGRFFGFSETEIKEKKSQEIIRKKAVEIFYQPEISGKTPWNSADLLNHAFMDLGASLCTAKKTECEKCPLQKECVFFQKGKILEKKTVLSSSLRGGLGGSGSKKKKGKKGAAPTVKNIQKKSVMVLHYQKKYFLIREKNAWKFPEFFQPIGQKKIDHRHFLQEKSLLTFGIEISVRPPFLKKILEDEETEYLFSRCQILRGEFFPDILSADSKISGKFFSKSEISELITEQKTPEKFSNVFEKVLKMRF